MQNFYRLQKPNTVNAVSPTQCYIPYLHVYYVNCGIVTCNTTLDWPKEKNKSNSDMIL